MAKTSQEQKSLTGMAGEFLVAAELFRRGIHASVTYGASKSADVFAITSDGTRALRIEVKTTPDYTSKWVGLAKAADEANWRDNVFYVLVSLPDAPACGPVTDQERAMHSPRFFVLSSRELGDHVRALDRAYLARYLERHGKPSTAAGVPQIPKTLVAQYENDWDKIELALRRLEDITA